MSLKTTFSVSKTITVTPLGTGRLTLLSIPSNAKRGQLETLAYEVRPAGLLFTMKILDRNQPFISFHQEFLSSFSVGIPFLIDVPLRSSAVLQVIVKNQDTAETLRLIMALTGYYEV